MLGGEAFLERVFNAYRSATAESGTNVWNTTLLIGWDEPGGTYDHVPPGPVPPPDPAAPAGEFGFTFDRSGYRVPAIIVSPWVEPGSVYNEEYRHTSLIATLRKTWDLGAPFTQRDASARTFDHVFTRGTPRDPRPGPPSRPSPCLHGRLTTDLGKALGDLGKDVGPASSSTPGDGGQRSHRNSTTPPPNSRPSSSSKSSGTSPATTSPDSHQASPLIRQRPEGSAPV